MLVCPDIGAGGAERVTAPEATATIENHRSRRALMRSESIFPAPVSRLLTAALALATLWAGAAAGPSLAGPSKEKQETVSEAESGAAQDAEAASGETAADGDWLVDDSGRQYRIEKVPKVEGAYKWMDEEHTWVLMPLGARFEVLKHDDNWFWVKDPKPLVELPKRVKKDEGPTAEEVAEVEARYRFEVEEGDRLTFQEFDRGLPRSGQWRNGFDVADMNGDGHLDIVFGPSRKGDMVPNVFLGDSAGNWRRWSEAQFPPLPYDYGDAEAADFNGDGHMDIAFGIHLRGMAVIVGDGRGKFTPWTEGIALTQPGQGGDLSSFSSRAVTSVDWNGDGHLDLLALGEGPKGGAQARQTGMPNKMDSSARGFLVYLNRGDGSWFTWRPLEGTDLRPTFGDDFVLADFNRDSFLDLVTASRQIGSKQILRLGREGGKIDVAKIDAAPPQAMVSAVAVGDLDGDGHDDLVLGYMNRELGVWRTGMDVLYSAPDLTWKRRALFSEESRRGVSALSTGDLDGDGNLDLAALTGRGEVWMFLGDGEGWLVRETESLMPAEQGCQGFGLALVDFDGDGRDELAASFAGEVTGMPGLPGLSHPGCTREGSLRVWKPTPTPSSR